MAARWTGAKWLGNGVSGGAFTSGPFKVVLHTTETRGVPGYNYGRSAPHLTYVPKTRTFVQHTSMLAGARALRNEAGGTQTNRDSAIQLEIVCYSQKSVADRYASSGAIWVGDLTEEHLADIRGFMHWAAGEFGIPWQWPERQAYSYAQANARGFRLTGDEFDNYAGFMAHQHVPENTHWDTGALNWVALMAQEPEEAMNALKEGDKGNMVALYRKAINRWNVLYNRPAPLPSGTVFDADMLKQVKAYQKAANVGFTRMADGTKVYNGVIDATLAFALGRYVLPTGSGTGQDGEDGTDGEDGADGLVEIRVDGVIVHP